MKRTRIVFFSILGLAAVIVVASKWSFMSQLVEAMPTTVAKTPTIPSERLAAKLPDLQKIPSEASLDAEVRDVIPMHSSLGSVNFVGEVVNTGQRAIAKPEIIISLLDEAGRRLAFETGYTIHDLIRPYETVPVTVLFTDPPDGWRSFEVFLQAKAATGREFMVYTDFTCGDDAISRDEYGYYIITGTVKNTGTAKADFVQSVVSLYGEDKKIVGMGSAYAEQSQLDPGEESPFRVLVMNVREPPAYCRVQFVGHAR